MKTFLDRIAKFLSTRAAALRGLSIRMATRPVPLWESLCGLILGLLTGGVLGRLL